MAWKWLDGRLADVMENGTSTEALDHLKELLRMALRISPEKLVVAFDVDGTLTHSMPRRKAVAEATTRHVAERLGRSAAYLLSVVMPDFERRYRAVPHFSDLFEGAVAVAGSDAEISVTELNAMYTAELQHYRAEHLELDSVPPSFLVALRRLAATIDASAISYRSQTRDEALVQFKRLGLVNGDDVEDVLDPEAVNLVGAGYDSSRRAKGDFITAHYQHLITAQRMLTGTPLYVGDSASDMWAAAITGFTFIGVYESGQDDRARMEDELVQLRREFPRAEQVFFPSVDSQGLFDFVSARAEEFARTRQRALRFTS